MHPRAGDDAIGAQRIGLEAHDRRQAVYTEEAADEAEAPEREAAP